MMQWRVYGQNSFIKSYKGVERIKRKIILSQKPNLST